MFMSSRTADVKDTAYQFLAANRIAALATVDKAGEPHVATVDFAVREDLNLYFITRVEARKYQNLIDHPTVAMAITDEAGLSTVQLTGQARRVNDLDLEETIQSEIRRRRSDGATWLSRAPGVQLFERGESRELAIIRVEPIEMTLANFSAGLPEQTQPLFQKII